MCTIGFAKRTGSHKMDTLVNFSTPGTIQDVTVDLDTLQRNKEVPLILNGSAMHPPHLSPESSPTATSSSASGSSSISGTMADDDLEYHITFPPPTTHPPVGLGPITKACDILADEGIKVELNGDSNGFVDVPNERKEPVVVLLGWFGCHDRHLAKYSKIYEGVGCITIRFISRANIILYQPENMRSTATKLLDLLVDFNLEEHPIFVHVFSSGGCYMYRHICELLNKNPLNRTFRVYGCVFDSGPAVNSPLNVFRAIQTTTRGNAVWRWICSVSIMFILYCAHVVEFLLGFVCSERRRVAPQAMWTCLAKDPSRCPQLFLYSKADNICNFKSIKLFALERRKCGVPVSEVCWEDSAHVKHFLVHKHEYIEHIVKFLDMCLAGAETMDAGPSPRLQSANHVPGRAVRQTSADERELRTATAFIIENELNNSETKFDQSENEIQLNGGGQNYPMTISGV